MNKRISSSELKSGRTIDKLTFNIKLIILIAIAVGVVSYIFSLNPIAQESSYHHFVDRTAFFSVPNFWNVLSNLGFLFVGAWGIYKSTTKPHVDYLSLFLSIGIALTCLGSSYYHWAPSNETLLWDRIPMTIIFMSFFTFIISEYISGKYKNLLLVIFLMIGIASVSYWEYTELHDEGDLRAYVVVQFLPMLLIPLILWLFYKKNAATITIIPIFLWYVVAKVCEHFDEQIFHFSMLSGHTIKHLFSSLSTYYMIQWTLKEKTSISLAK